jgi:hypothetical protein
VRRDFPRLLAPAHRPRESNKKDEFHEIFAPRLTNYARAEDDDSSLNFQWKLDFRSMRAKTARVGTTARARAGEIES